MGYKVKCRHCKKTINSNNAYKVPYGKVNRYFCNKDEYLLEYGTPKIKDQTYSVIYDIFGRKVTNTVLYKEINELSLIYEYEKIKAYLSQNEKYLNNVIRNKEFQSEYAQIRYFAAILKNSLSDFKYEKEENIKKETEIDIPSCNFNRREKRKTIDEYEQEVGDEV